SAADVSCIAVHLGHTNPIAGYRARTSLLGHVRGGWIRRDFRAGRHAHLSGRSYGDGSRHRLRLLVRSSSFGVAGVWAVGGSSQVWHDFRHDELAADPRHSSLVLVKPEGRLVEWDRAPRSGVRSLARVHVFCVPLERIRDHLRTPNGVRAILDTPPACDLGAVCIPVVRAKNVRVPPAKLLTRLRRG